MDGGKAGEVFYDARLDQDQLRADYHAAEEELRRSGKVGGDAFGDGLEKGAKEGANAVRSESKKAADATEKNLGGAALRVKEGFTKAQAALAAIGIGVGLAGVLTFMNGAINAASDLNEEASKTEVVFGQAAGKVKDFASTADTALGQSERQALGAAGGFGNMFKTIGFADDAAADMSVTMVKLASDMASFNNQDPADMLERLRSGLSGEAEPLRTFGVLISEARVKAKAYELGIAEAGAELTEQQKVVARYNLILEDTALQQGDFARTADGLANSQRTLAAQWENAQARIGQALLPVAQAMVGLASDVLPRLADGFLDVFDALTPFAKVLTTIGGLWLDHADVILPALVLMLGVKLVAGLSAAEIKTRALTVAMNGLRTAALLGLPVVIDLAQGLLDVAGELGDELGLSAEGVEKWKEVWDRMDHAFWEDPLVGMANFKEEARALGVDWTELADTFLEQNERTGISLDEFLARLRAWKDGTAAELQEGVNRWSQTLAGQRGILEGAARPLEDAIADPLEDGADRGVSAIDGMFSRIAAAIKAREDELRNAGGNAVDAWLEPQTLGYEIAALESELASQELRDNLKSKDPEIRRDAEKRRLEITAELVKLRNEQATTGDEMAQIAAQKSILTSQFMRDGLMSEDPEIRALFRDWQQTLEGSIGDMESDARRNRTGPNFKQGIDEWTGSIHGSIRNYTSVRPDTSWAYNSGYGLGSSFAAGMAAWVGRVKQVSIDLGEAAATGIRLRSPAKEGALSEPAGVWMRKLITDWLAPVDSYGIPAAAAKSKQLAGAVASMLMGGGVPGFAFAGAGLDSAPPALGGAAAGGVNITERHVHIHAEAGYNVLEDETDLLRTAQQAMWFDEMSV